MTIAFLWSSTVFALAIIMSAKDQDSSTMKTPLASNTTTRKPAAPPSCVPCSSLDKSHLLDKADVEKRVAENLPMWKVGEKKIAASGGGESGCCYLYRSFTAKNFQAALDAINAFGAVAEAESHHPNLHLTNYREVAVEIWTHKLNGVTENDLTLAAQLDAQVRNIEYSPKWLKGHPEAASTAKEETKTFDV